MGHGFVVPDHGSANFRRRRVRWKLRTGGTLLAHSGDASTSWIRRDAFLQQPSASPRDDARALPPRSAAEALRLGFDAWFDAWFVRVHAFAKRRTNSEADAQRVTATVLEGALREAMSTSLPPSASELLLRTRTALAKLEGCDAISEPPSGG